MMKTGSESASLLAEPFGGPPLDEVIAMLGVINSGILLTVLKLVISLISIWLGYRIISKYLFRVGKQLHLEEHILNLFQLLARIGAVWFAVIAVVQILGMPTDWLVGASALAGTVIGFGSSQTIGNFLAGLYILISRPFTLYDFVKIGDVEGQVEEISINYTMVYTWTRNLIKIPNRQVLNSKILHCTKENVIDHSFNIGFDHSLNNKIVTKNILEPAIEEFYEKHKKRLLELPKYYLIDSDRVGKTFSIRLFFRKGDARSLYNLQPLLRQMILDRYYVEKKAG